MLCQINAMKIENNNGLSLFQKTKSRHVSNEPHKSSETAKVNRLNLTSRAYHQKQYFEIFENV